MSDKLQAEQFLRTHNKLGILKEGTIGYDVAISAIADALSSSQQVRDDALDEAARIADNAEWEDGFRIDNPLPAQIAFSIRKLRSDFNKVTGVFSSMEIGTDPIIPSVAPAFPSQPSSVAMTDAHEVWAAAQLLPGEGILDGVMRIENILQSSPKGASTGTERVLDLYDKIECDLPYLFGRASAEGHEVGQQLAKEVRAKMKLARPALTPPFEFAIKEAHRLAEQGMCHGLLADDYCSQIVALLSLLAASLSSPQEASKPQDDLTLPCEGCDGFGYIGTIPATHFQPSEQIICDVCNGYGKYKVSASEFAASQPSAASGRELPPLPNTAYWWSPKTSSGMTQGLACWSTNSGPHPAWDITDYYTADQMREYALAALSAAPADANVGGLTDREIMEEWDRHYLTSQANGTPFLRVVVAFARHFLARPTATTEKTSPPADVVKDAGINLAELKKLAEAATPGPWDYDTEKNDGEYGHFGPDSKAGFKSYAIHCTAGTLFDTLNSDMAEIHEEWDEDSFYAWDDVGRRNAEYVAAANPKTILALIAAIGRMRSESGKGGEL